MKIIEFVIHYGMETYFVIFSNISNICDQFLLWDYQDCTGGSRWIAIVAGVIINDKLYFLSKVSVIIR